MEKECFKCHIILEITKNFYKHPQMPDGYLNKCKEGTKKDTINNRQNKLEYYREYDRLRGRTEERKERVRLYQKLHPEVHKKANDAWFEKNPYKKKAEWTLGNAVRDGKILKQPCEICNTEQGVESHHDDYDKPLEVRWLCDKHHKEYHRNIREEKRQKAA